MKNYWTDKIEQKACAKEAHELAIKLNFAARNVDADTAKLLYKARDLLRELRNSLSE